MAKDSGADFLKMMQSKARTQHKQSQDSASKVKAQMPAPVDSESETKQYDVTMNVQKKSERKQTYSFTMMPKRHDELVKITEYYGARSYSAMLETMIEALYKTMQQEKNETGDN